MKKNLTDKFLNNIDNSSKITDDIFITVVKRKQRIKTIKEIKKYDRNSKTIACNAKEYNKI